jgi:hypothetical protein
MAEEGNLWEDLGNTYYIYLNYMNISLPNYSMTFAFSRHFHPSLSLGALQR